MARLRSPSMLDVQAPTRRSIGRPLIAWGALIVVALVWGRALVLSHHHLDLGAPPFWSPFRLHPSLRLVPALAVAGIVIRYGPAASRRLTWRSLMGATAVATAAWAVALAYVDNLDGVHALTDPVTFRRNDYLQTARSISSVPAFLRHFIATIDGYPQHTKGHPPGMVVIEWILDRAGLASAGWTAALFVAGGVAAGLAALMTLREVAGEYAARLVAPFMVLVPAAIWWSTADAFYAGVSAWAIALVVLASGRSGRRADRFALAGGFAFGVTAFLSYGLVLMAVIPVVVCGTRRRWRPLIVAALAALPVFVAFAAMGYSWTSGFAATRRVYWSGVAVHRPYLYFLLADLALLAVAVGPAIAGGLANLRDRNAWLLVGAIGAVVAMADVSGMSKGEVERIWLPFVPWAMLAVVGLSAEARSARRTQMWLLLQVTSTVVVATTIWSQW